MQTKTRDWYYPTAYSVWGEEEPEAIARVMQSGRFTMGEEVEAFEAEFAQWHGMKHGIMVNSGSSANLVAVAAMFNREYRKLRVGDKVIVPAMAWATTYAPLVQHGLDLVLADCNGQWNVGQYHGEPAISMQVVCSILGNPAHFWGEAPWPIIEDNCESLGAVDLKGRKCGTRGLMNTFSFFWSHQLSAIEGGMILTNDDECMRLCRMLRAHGWTRDLPDRVDHFQYDYDFRVMGYNVRPTEIHAAIAREQLKKLPAALELRRKNANHFRLAAMQAKLPLEWPIDNGVQSPFGIHFEFQARASRNSMAKKLRAHGIDCRLPVAGSLTRHMYGKQWAAQTTPNADRIHDCGMFIGNGPLDLSEQIERAVRVMSEQTDSIVSVPSKG